MTMTIPHNNRTRKHLLAAHTTQLHLSRKPPLTGETENSKSNTTTQSPHVMPASTTSTGRQPIIKAGHAINHIEANISGDPLNREIYMVSNRKPSNDRLLNSPRVGGARPLNQIPDRTLLRRTSWPKPHQIANARIGPKREAWPDRARSR
jgi:hypothetical protein